MEFNFLKKRFGIGRKIDDFLDKVSEAGLLFQQGVDAYLKGNQPSFVKKIEDIASVEHVGDALRRDLEEQLYTQTLIPESRGDVLALLENMDGLLDRFKGALWRFEIEQPEIYPELHDDIRELAACAVESVEAMVRSARAFFKDVAAVADHLHKVSYWETQSDKVSTRIQSRVFREKERDLSYRMQLRDIIRHVDKITDRAEDVADKLRIYVIKRSL
jgi:predicted phosphate transport protein (TIGR00153 family)